MQVRSPSTTAATAATTVTTKTTATQCWDNFENDCGEEEKTIKNTKDVSYKHYVLVFSASRIYSDHYLCSVVLLYIAIIKVVCSPHIRQSMPLSLSLCTPRPGRIPENIDIVFVISNIIWQIVNDVYCLYYH